MWSNKFRLAASRRLTYEVIQQARSAKIGVEPSQIIRLLRDDIPFRRRMTSTGKLPSTWRLMRHHIIGILLVLMP
jgi:hypothetical protein